MHPNTSLAPLLSPASVAVVGASRSRTKVGGMVLANLLAAGYKGGVHAVNPAAAAKGEAVQGLSALADAADLPPGVDLGVVCLPREQTAAALAGLAARGCRAAIVLAAGFRETGREGSQAEHELTRMAQDAGMLLLGPNSLGLMNTACGLNVSFAGAYPRPGGVSFFSQSGAMCVCVLDWAMARGLGFSKFVSLGNKALLREADILRALGDDPDTRVIAGYCESVEDGGEFLAAAREVSAKKPVLLLKAGTTAAGARAVSAHTGAASGSPAAYRAAFRQAGVIRVEEMSQLFGLAQAFASQPLPAGPGLAVLTNAGGPGILAADACARTGLTLPRPGAVTLERLAGVLPGFASMYNPVDILGDAGPERYRAALEILADDPQAHSLLVLLTPTAPARAATTAKAVAEVARSMAATGRAKPLAACFLGREGVRQAREALLAAQVPCYDFPEAAVQALDALHQRARRLDPGDSPPACGPGVPAPGAQACDAPWDDEALSIVDAALAQGLTELSGVTALEAAHAAGLPVLTTALARTSAEAKRLAAEIGLPVSLRLAVTDAGPTQPEQQGRFARLADEDAVARAFLALTSTAARLRPEAYVTGCLVQSAAGVPSAGFALAAGFQRDAQFGPLVSFGRCGAGAEFSGVSGVSGVSGGNGGNGGDVSYRLAPMTPHDAREMLREVRFFPLLRGVSGGAVVSLAALERLLLAISRFALAAPRLAGADFSPVLAGPEGLFITGARLTLG